MKTLEDYLQKTNNREGVLESNKQHIIDFLKFESAEVCLRRIDFYYYRLIKIAGWIKKDFKEMTETDIRELVHKIESSELEGWGKTCLKISIKKFYKWLEGDNEEYPKKVKWIKTAEKSYRTKKPEDLLNETEIWNIISHANSIRDKAFFFVLYESGARPHELLAQKIKHIQFKPYGFLLTIPSGTKTGLRKIPLIKSHKMLKQYIEAHPDHDNPEAPLWFIAEYKEKKRVIRAAPYSSMYQALKDSVKRSGIKKRVNPYVFRHSRATILSTQLKEAQMKQYFGWAKGSDMPGTYIHLSGKDLEDSVLKMNGIKTDKEGEEKKEMINCPRCEKPHIMGTDFCSSCGQAMQIKAVIEKENKQEHYFKFLDLFMPLAEKWIAEDPAKQKQLMEIREQMKK